VSDRPSAAADKLARTRLAIIEHVHGRERRHEPRSAPESDGLEALGGAPPARRRLPRARGWLARLRYAASTWWRHHPAHMALELGTPALQSFAQRHPARLLGISALAGATLMLVRPWRVISVTTVVVALLKSSQLSSVLLSALSAADYGRDREGPE
jgi:hypothetical protein